MRKIIALLFVANSLFVVGQVDSVCKPGKLSAGLRMEIPQFTNASLASANPINKFVVDASLSNKYRVEVEGGYKSSDKNDVEKEMFDVGGGLFLMKQHGVFNVYGGPRVSYVSYKEVNSLNILTLQNSIDKTSLQTDGGILFGAEYMPTKWASLALEFGLSYFSWKEERAINIDESITGLLGETSGLASQANSFGINAGSIIDQVLGTQTTTDDGMRVRFGMTVRVYIYN